MDHPSLICYPPAPQNGGALDHAPAKVGAWDWQPKIDDWRAVIHAPTGSVWNQYGQLSSISAKFPEPLRQLQDLGVEWLDAGLMENRHDMMRGSIVVLDLIDRHAPFADRRNALESAIEVLPDATALSGRAHNRLFLIPNVHGEEAGRALYEKCKELNQALSRKFYEGGVAKRSDSLYHFGQRPKQKIWDWIKHRFDQ